MSRIFVISPANCSGPRAQMVMSERAQFDLAVRLRQRRGVAIGEVSQLVTNFFEGQKQMKAMFSGNMPGACAPSMQTISPSFFARRQISSTGKMAAVGDVT